MFTYYGIFIDRNAMVWPNFFNQNSYSWFLDIFKKGAKNPLFSGTITILDHTMYGKVKKKKEI